MLDSSAFPKTAEAIRATSDQGLQAAGQLYVSRYGRALLDEGFGSFPSGRPCGPETIFPWMSASKPVTALAVGQLWERGLLELDDRVTEFIPEFGSNGKEEISVRHLLTHTGGFRSVAVGWPDKSWEEIVAGVCAMRLEPRWSVGRKAGYHLTSSWFVLGELIQRLTGRPFSSYVREEIFQPCDMDQCWIGMTASQFGTIRPQLAEMEDTSRDRPKKLPWMSEKMVTRPSPGRSGVGPARQLGRFYEMLLNHGKWAERVILASPTVEAMTAAHRVGLHDHTFKHIVDWGLGFIVNSSHYGPSTVPYGYGGLASRRTFGHSGYQSSAAFADREHGLVVVVIFSGAPGNDAHEGRIRRVLDSIYLDLDLAAE